MASRPARKWGATDAALVLAAAAIVPKWSRWLNERQTQRKRVEGEDGEEEEWVFYRPTSGLHLAQGFGTTFGYLALLDLLVARRVVQQGQKLPAWQRQSWPPSGHHGSWTRRPTL